MKSENKENKENKKNKESEESEEQADLVTLFDVNENPVQVAQEEVDNYLKNSYRVSLPKKPKK